MSDDSPSLLNSPLVVDWLDLSTIGRIGIRTGKVEIGQRIYHALTHIVAEELGIPPGNVELHTPTTGQCPNEGYTSGSNSIEHSGAALRLAAATLREHCRGLAAERFCVERHEVTDSDGIFRGPLGNETASYWELVTDTCALPPVDVQAPTRISSGKASQRTHEPHDMTRKLAHGRVEFLHDLTRPGMLHARMVRAARPDAVLVTSNEQLRQLAAPLEFVRDGNFLAITGDDEYEVTRKAAQLALHIHWRLPQRSPRNDPRQWDTQRTDAMWQSRASIAHESPDSSPPGTDTWPESAMEKLDTHSAKGASTLDTHRNDASRQRERPSHPQGTEAEPEDFEDTHDSDIRDTHRPNMASDTQDTHRPNMDTHFSSLQDLVPDTHPLPLRACSESAASQARASPTQPSQADVSKNDHCESMLVIDGVPVPGSIPSAAPVAGMARYTHCARYTRAFQLHGSMGPSAALAHFDGEILHVISHSQGIYPLRAVLAQCLDMDESNIVVEHALGAGCYGHNGADDAALDAALVALARVGKPVLLKWTRHDEHRHEPCATAMAVELHSAIDGDGRICHWRHAVFGGTHGGRPRTGPGGVGPSRMLAATQRAHPAAPFRAAPNLARHGGNHRNAQPLYAVPSPRIEKHLIHDLALRTSSMRSLGAFANVFAIESFFDELATLAGVDPLTFRLQHLDDERARETLQRAAQAIGWGQPVATHHGLGLGFARYKNSQAWCAVALEVRVDDAAQIHLQRAAIAADTGHVVDQQGLAAQLEGGFIQAASWALYEEVRFDDTGVCSDDWDSYPILGFDNVPHIDVMIIDRPEHRSLGAGEAACGPTGGAIANAVFAATGLRCRDLPLRPERLRELALRNDP